MSLALRPTRRPPLGLLAAAVAVALGALAPVGYLFDRAAARGWSAAWRELAQRRTFDLLIRSITIATMTTVLCVVVGVAAAVLVSRTDLPGSRIWRVVLALPLAIPTYLAAYAWVSARPTLAGMGGATLVLVLCSYPYVFLPVTAALSRLDRSAEEVARACGHRPLSVIWRVTLPQVRPAIASGALLVALYVLSDFGAVGTMRYESFTWVIFGAYNAGFNPSRAAVLSLVLVAVAVVITIGEIRARGIVTARSAGAAARRGTAIALRRWSVAATGFLTAVTALSIGFPLFSLSRWLARSASLDVDWGVFRRSAQASLALSALAAAITVALALPAGLLAARHRGRASTLVERSTYIAHALPGIVIAIAIVHVGIRAVRPLYQRTPLLIAAYVVIFIPLAVGNVRAAFEQCPPRLEEIARTLGRSRRRAAVEVATRLAAPGLAAGAALTFLAAMKELPATLLLHPTGTDTLATRLWTYTSVSDYGNAAPYAAALMLFAAIPTAVLGWFTGRLVGNE
jgi:iron(III) transport system permease protein